MINNNKKGLDTVTWEQLPFAPVTGLAGTNIVDDGERYIYMYFQTSTTTAQFWRYNTFNSSYQQLALPPTQTGTIANMTYVSNMGDQWKGITYGSIYLFVGNGIVCYLYKYNIATNTWTTLNTTNVPATFATDVCLESMSPSKNNNELTYHSGTTRSITTSAAVAVGETSISVNAISEVMTIGTRLRFGTFDITTTSSTAAGATTIAVSSLVQGLALGTQLTLLNGEVIGLAEAATAGATSLTVYPIQMPIASGVVIKVEQYVVLTAAATAGATSLTISPTLYSIASGATAGYYGNLYLIGNNATQLYRYNIGNATWSTTTSNSGNAAFPVLPGAIGAGCALKWLPSYQQDKLCILRGNATSSIYLYDLITNTGTTETYYPSTETFTTGTQTASRNVGGKKGNLLIQKDGTTRIFERVPYKSVLEPKMMQFLYPNSTTVVGNKTSCIKTPDGVEYYYNLLHSSPAFVRTALLDS